MLILIIGKTPPPIGGVTIHVQRLLNHIDNRNINYSYYMIRNTVSSQFSLIKKVLSHKKVHLHASNPYFRFYISFICRILKKPLINTYHGNIGRFNKIKNFFDNMSIRLSRIPIVLNEDSFIKAKKLNSSTIQLSAFIPPINEENLPNIIQNKILYLKKKFKRIFCTNAYKNSKDINGNEIYGCTMLIQVFKKTKNLALIFSDPSGECLQNVKNKQIEIPDNIFFIDYPHNFYEILKETDGFIRATTTDGDSISLREALSLNKIVIASDCVTRPNGCILFKTGDKTDLFNKLEINNFEKISIHNDKNNVINKLIKLYSD
ncbi:MAG: glycosyltransferase [Bacteroidales bacterium]|nr:glycosyltransferase [Bacteroidales bacterium]